MTTELFREAYRSGTAAEAARTKLQIITLMGEGNGFGYPALKELWRRLYENK
jgi:hypothetical protein